MPIGGPRGSLKSIGGPRMCGGGGPLGSMAGGPRKPGGGGPRLSNSMNRPGGPMSGKGPLLPGDRPLPSLPPRQPGEP